MIEGNYFSKHLNSYLCLKNRCLLNEKVVKIELKLKHTFVLELDF